MTDAPRYAKRLIEVDLPIKRISEHARREKSIRHGHISTLHIWWARRPLAACRAVICAALWPDPADELCPQAFRDAVASTLYDFAEKARTGKEVAELCKAGFGHWQRLGRDAWRPSDPACWWDMRHALLEFIADFANWDASNVPAFLETSRRLTQAAHEALGGEPGTRPLVVDPFAGGGSIPLEALRVGADTFASDLNPVAVLLNKVVLEYVPKYGQRLADEVRKWGEWVKKEAQRELGEFYPKDPDGATPVAYFWARTVISEAPGTQGPVEIPLLRSLWIAKGRTPAAFRWARDRKGRIRTEVVRHRLPSGIAEVHRPMIEVFKPTTVAEVERGTSAGGAATCPITGFTTSVEAVRKQLSERKGGAADARLIAVAVTRTGASGKHYRLPELRDTEVVARAMTKLERLGRERSERLPLVPDEPLNHLRGFFNVVLYGMTSWGDLFAPRQQLALVSLSRLVGSASIPEDGGLGTAIRTCLAMAVSRCADKTASLVVWNSVAEKVEHVFGRQALPMVWDFVEANPLSEIGWDGACEWIVKVLAGTAEADLSPGRVEQASARQHPLPDDAADATVTDPPYYAAIPYADLSDFFYVWLRRCLFQREPVGFHDRLTPKEDECVALAHRAAMYRQKDAAWFERMMTEAMCESRRITKQHGISVVVFANKETAAWEAMIGSLVAAGWCIAASWPIETEKRGRLRAQDSAALASSVHLVCRPRETVETGDWRDVLGELPKRIHEWMPRLAQEGVVGADAIFACLGPALEVFSRYSRVEKSSGDVVVLREYLEHVWAAIAKEALSMIFAGADATGFEEDARLTAMWLWTVCGGAANGVSAGTEEGGEDDEDGGAAARRSTRGFSLEYDAARKIGQGLGAHLEEMKTLVEITGETARLLSVAERSRALFGKGEELSGPAKRKKDPQLKLDFAEELEQAEQSGGWGPKNAPPAGKTTLDRVHQAMLLFGAGRGEALRRFLVDEGTGRDERLWRLAQALASLYPRGTEERRWVEGVLARKKGLGL